MIWGSWLRRALPLATVAACAMLLFAAPLLAQAQDGKRLSTTEIEKLHRLIKPQAGEEKWQEIPWLTDLWQARQQAAAQGKRILLWEMDGHPLGCV